MEERYVYLTHASRSVSQLMQERLKEGGVNSRLRNTIADSFTSLFGANSWFGYTITVPESQLQVAKSLINAHEDLQENIPFEIRRKSVYVVARIFIALALISILILFFALS